MATRLMEEMKRTDLTPFRSKAVVRMLEQVGQEREVALRRATELTQEYLAVLLQPLVAGKLAQQLVLALLQARAESLHVHARLAAGRE